MPDPADLAEQGMPADMPKGALPKGLPPGRALVKYPLRMALNPFIADIGNLLPDLISGSALVAVVLSLPTTGPVESSAENFPSAIAIDVFGPGVPSSGTNRITPFGNG